MIKYFQYAILTSEIYESNVEIAKQFNLGSTESVLLEGENIKVLCLSMDDNKISVFMDKHCKSRLDNKEEFYFKMR